MARLHISPAMPILFLSCAATLMFLPASLATQDGNLSKEYGVPPAVIAKLESEEPPEPAPGYYQFLEDCSKKLSLECGKEIYTQLTKDENISTKCCRGLLDIGYTCHHGLIKTALRWPELKPYASQILPRSDHAWNWCVVAVQKAASSSD